MPYSREHSVSPFREIALRKHDLGVTWTTMAARGGTTDKELGRRLGIYNERRGKPVETITQRTAEMLCRALNLNPVEMGIDV